MTRGIVLQTLCFIMIMMMMSKGAKSNKKTMSQMLPELENDTEVVATPPSRLVYFLFLFSLLDSSHAILSLTLFPFRNGKLRRQNVWKIENFEDFFEEKLKRTNYLNFSPASSKLHPFSQSLHKV